MKTRWLILLLLNVATLCHADRDIVYAARYYTPPGSHRTSHFHIYRINPDGTGRTQLTFGTDDDSNPKWSPDGKWIAFTRVTATGSDTLCLMRANGHSVKATVLRGDRFYFFDIHVSWSPDSQMLAGSNGDDEKPITYIFAPTTGHLVRQFVGISNVVWSPDSHHTYLQAASGGKVLDLRTGALYPVKDTPQDAFESPIGLGPYIVGYSINEKSRSYWLRFLNAERHEIKQVKLNFSLGMPSGIDAPFYPYQGDTLLTVSSSQRLLVYALNDHNSSGDNWFFLLLDTTAGTMHYITEGLFLALSPDRARFCVARRRDTTAYERRKYPFPSSKDESAQARIEAENRMVWFAPLYIRAASGGKMRQLTPRLSWVTGADWRKGN